MAADTPAGREPAETTGRNAARPADVAPKAPSQRGASAPIAAWPAWPGYDDDGVTSASAAPTAHTGVMPQANWPASPASPAGLGVHLETAWLPQGRVAPVAAARTDDTFRASGPAPLAAYRNAAPPRPNGQAATLPPSAFHPSANAALAFTLTDPVPISQSASFSFALPSAFYQSLHQTFSVGAGGFAASAYVNVAGGIKASATLSLGTILPDYHLSVNAETVGYVKDGNVFTVSPTLISTDDARFSLGLPTAALDAAIGLLGQAGVSLEFPSVSVGFSVFGHFIGYTLAPPPVSKSLSVGGIETLPADKRVDVPGGYAVISTLPAATYTTSGTSAQYGIPTLTTHAYTKPILQANIDILGAIGQYVPELQALDGSKDFGIGSATWSLLSLPLRASLELENRSTVTELGFSARLTENYGGNTNSQGTRQVTVGTLAGGQWQLLAPSSGGGVIDLELDYALTLAVQSTISLAGSFGLTLDGPQGLVTLFGHDFGISPLFSVPLFDQSGDLLDITSASNTLTLTATQHQLVFYGPMTVPQTLVNSQSMSYQLKAGGEVFVLPKGLFIAPSTQTTGSQFGVVGTLGAGAVYNYGNIYAAPKSGTVSAGIQLIGGGKVVNTGNINSTSGGGGHFAGAVTYGIEIGGDHSTIVNSGRIANSTKAEIQAVGSGSIYVYNTASGIVLGGLQDGISASTARLNVHNDGSIAVNNAFGIYAKGGLLLASSTSGYIGGGASGHTLSPIPAASVFGGADSFVRNDGFINVGTSGTHAIGSGRIGIDLTSGGLVQNTGTIGGQLIGVQLGAGNNDTTYLINAGLIETASTAAAAAAVTLQGTRNNLGLRTGARFQGGVTASASSGAQYNQILLGGGAGIGTLSMLSAANFQNFGVIRDNGQGGAWLLQTTATFAFGGATLTGLTTAERIEFQGLPYQTSDEAHYDAAAHKLYLTDGNGSTLSVLNVNAASGTNFHVTGNGTNTYIREYKGNFTNVVTGVVGPQTIDANSYYGGRVTIAAGAKIGNLPGAPAYVGLRLNPVYADRTTTVQGTSTTRSVLVPAQVTNHGLINGSSRAIDLETAGTIANPDGTIASQGVGIYQAGTLSGAFLGNSRFIYGFSNAVSLGARATIVNLSGGSLRSYGLGAAVGAGSAVYNSGAILGSGAGAIELGANSSLLNAAGSTVFVGHINGGGFGVHGMGAGVTVTNSGFITGAVGVTLSAGGVVANTYQVNGGNPVLGNIYGDTYGVAITGGSGTVVNQIGTLTAAPTQGTIAGISLGAGGVIFNGALGTIAGNGQYAVNLGNAPATLGNGGQIGRVRAGARDAIFNASGGTLAAIVGQAASSGGRMSVSNQGLIGGAGAAGPAITTAAAAYIQNSGTIQSGSGPAIALAAGGTIVTSGAILGGAGAGPIDFGTAAATLTLLPGASFSGNVNANSADTLVLGGTSTATLSGLGTAFANFGTYRVAAGASWTLAGVNTLAANWTIAGTVVSGNGVGLYHGLSITGAATVNGALLGANATHLANTTGHYRGAAGAQVAAGGRLINTGRVAGGYGTFYGAGGDGVDVDRGILVNTGTIAGGSFQTSQMSGNGGIGVKLASATLTNIGTIRGGDGLNANSSYGAGGIGLLMYGGTTATNRGTILGGAGTLHGGYGAEILVGTLTNTGRITGGAGVRGGASAAGVYLAGGTLVTSGTIAGGGPDAAAIRFGTQAATLQINAGAVFAGAIAATRADDLLVLGIRKSATLTGLGTRITGFAQISELAGGNWTLAGSSTIGAGTTVTSRGTLAVAGTLANAGVIAAAGSAPPAGSPGYGGITLASGLLVNTGSISAGSGQFGGGAGKGGDGVTVRAGTLTNTGTIAGGAGGYSNYYSGNGNGGVGVMLGTRSVLNNTGRIVGGSLGNTNHGGVGMVATGATVMNSGTITGGVGYGGGGVGAYLNGGTLTNSGLISGGSINGTVANAITFGPTPATLVITTSARFLGTVAANNTVNDTLRLSGTGGTLSGLGTAFTGFSAISAAAGASWTLAGTQTFAGTLSGPGALKLTGTLTGSGAITLAAGTRLSATGSIGAALANLGTITVGKGTLALGASVSGAGSIILGSLSTLALAGSGTLATALSGPGRLRVDGAWSAGAGMLAPSAVQIGPAGTLRSFGTLTVATTNDGALIASGGTLALATTIAGTGTLGADQGATLLLSAGGSLTEAVAGAGTLLLQNTWVTTTAPLTIASIAIAAGGSLSATGTLTSALQNSGTLLSAGGALTVSGALSGTGNLTAAAGSQLILSGGGTFSGNINGAGQVDIVSGLTLGVGASLTAAHLTETANLLLAAGETLTTDAATALQITAATTVSLTGSTASKLVNGGQLTATGPGKTTLGLAFMNSGTVLNSGGTLLLSRGITNTGLIEVDHGAVTASAMLTGAHGRLALGADGVLTLARVSAGQNLSFLAHAGKLRLSDPLHFLGTITGFSGTASIDLLATTADGLSFANGVLTVTKTGGAVAALHLQGSYTAASFSLTGDGHGGTFIRLG